MRCFKAIGITLVTSLINTLFLPWSTECSIANGFPTEECKGKDMLFIAGGIGLAPLRSFIKYCFKHREDYGKITIIYGSRSYADLCFKDELFNEWPEIKDTDVYVTIDNAEEGWTVM